MITLLKNIYHWTRKLPMYLINYSFQRILSFYQYHASKDRQQKHFNQDGFIKLDELPDKHEINNDFDFVFDLGINETCPLRLNRLWGVKSDFLTFSMDAKDELLFKYVYCNPKIIQLIKNYYGRNFYLRNNPTIEVTDTFLSHETQIFHIDYGLNQISFFLNLNEISENSYQTEFLKGSQKIFYTPSHDRFSLNFKNRVNAWLYKYPEAVSNTRGCQGSGFLMDVGSGMHRGAPGSRRVMLALNFASNFAHTGWRKSWQPDDEAGKYFFSNPDILALERAKSLNLPPTFFSMVFQKIKPSPFIPKVYSKNF
jgi:hypothetical protein